MKQQASPPTFNFFTTAIIWIVLLAGVTLLFNNLLDRLNNPNQTLQISINEYGDKELTLEQNRYGQYWATGQINGHSIDFLLDTGATYVAVPEHLADRLGLIKGAAQKTVTANGTSLSYQTRIDTISLGDIVMNNVPASISTGMEFDEVLLGMSFLKHLKLSQQGKLLTITVPE